MNRRLIEAEKALETVLSEQSKFKTRHEETLLRVQSCRDGLAAAQEDLREAKIAAVLDESAQPGLLKKKKAVAGLQDELEEAEIQVIALSRKVAELENTAADAREALRKTKIEILLEKCSLLRDRYNSKAFEYETAFRELSVCVGALDGLNARDELKKYPGFKSFPRPVQRADGFSATNILQLSTQPNGELSRVIPSVVSKEDRSNILASLLE
jgi:chromosome segregation ATPase